MIPIFADFMRFDGHRVELTTTGSREGLAAQGIELREGLPLVLRMDDVNDAGVRDDLLVDGVAVFDTVQGIWMAEIDESTWRRQSEDAPAE